MRTILLEGLRLRLPLRLRLRVRLPPVSEKLSPLPIC